MLRHCTHPNRPGWPAPWLSIALVIGTAAFQSDAAPPNFVIIMADDLGYGDLSGYGGWIHTPSIDALGTAGIRFTDFHSSGNVCSPTRAGLMTGRYQQRASIPGVVLADPKRPVHYHGLQLSEYTLAQALASVGYATGIFGKWHLGYEAKYNPVHHGFDFFRGYVSGNVDFVSHIDQSGAFDWWNRDMLYNEQGYTTHLITEHAVEFIHQHKDRPFLLYLPHEAPHYPYQGPRDPAIRTVNGPIARELERPDRQNAYREMVQEVDSGVRAVVEALQANGLREQTLVMFFSDNGANARGSNGVLRGYKGSNWEGGHRVPCVAAWPGTIQPNQVTDQLAITLDVMPTLLELASAAADSSRPLDGISLAPLLCDGKAPGSRQLFWNGKAMRDGDWKLVLSGNGAQQSVGLYNLAEDLRERNNLAAAHPERVRQMRSDLATWQEEVASGATEQPADYAERQSAKAKQKAASKK